VELSREAQSCADNRLTLFPYLTNSQQITLNRGRCLGNTAMPSGEGQQELPLVDAVIGEVLCGAVRGTFGDAWRRQI